MAEVGELGWLDLTVDDADGVRDFYAKAVGFRPQPVDMGEYADYNMTSPESGTARAGVCHRRGQNAEIPPVWIPYFQVAGLEARVAAVEAEGGTLLSAIRGSASSGRYVFVRDPAGAVCALFEKGSE